MSDGSIARELERDSVTAMDKGWAFQHIAIAGISFCGSTLLSTMLGSLNGVTNIGESQKLIVNLDMTENTPDYVNNIPGKGVKPCKTCGPFCSVYTHEFRRELKENQQDWYIKIARQSKTNILVSSDKNYRQITKLDPDLNHDSIVLFKSPVTACNSFYRKYIDPNMVNHTKFNFDQVSAAWKNAYKKFLDNYETKGQKIFLSFDQFTLKPDYHMRVICERLGLQYDPGCLNTLAQEQHYFGGNKRVNRPYVRKEKSYEIVEKDEIVLPEEYISDLTDNVEIQNIYKTLMMNYESVFNCSHVDDLATGTNTGLVSG